MSYILQSIRLMQRQFATHLTNPILRRFPRNTTTPKPNPSISQQGFLFSLPRPLYPRIGERWSMIPKPSIRPSVFHNVPILSSTFQNILPLRNPALTTQPVTENTNVQLPSTLPQLRLVVEEEDILYDRIDRWSRDVALSVIPQDSLIDHQVRLTDQVIHDLVANRFVFPILSPDDL